MAGSGSRPQVSAPGVTPAARVESPAGEWRGSFADELYVPQGCEGSHSQTIHCSHFTPHGATSTWSHIRRKPSYSGMVRSGPASQ